MSTSAAESGERPGSLPAGAFSGHPNFRLLPPSGGKWDRVSSVAMPAEQTIDWTQCPLVEANPCMLSGALVLRGTRMPVNAIFDNFDYGVTVAEISVQFEVPEDRIQAILAYAKSHRVAHLV